MPSNLGKRLESQWRLLTAATTVFARDGYDRAALSDVAREAGFTTGAIYSHFRDKEHLFVAVAHEFADDMVLEIRRLPDTFNDPESAIAEVAARYVDVVDGWPEWPLLVQAILSFRAHRSDSRDARDLTAALEGVQREMAGVLERLASSLRRVLRWPPSVAARTVGASLYGLALERALNPAVIDDAALRSLASAALEWSLERAPIVPLRQLETAPRGRES